MTKAPLFDVVWTHKDVMDDVGFTYLQADWALFPLLNGDVPLVYTLKVAEHYGLDPNGIFRWQKSGRRVGEYVKWRRMMDRRWDRYRRYWVERTRTCRKQSYSLEFKRRALSEYLNGTSSLREVAQKYGIDKRKLGGWYWRHAQV